MSKHVSYLLKMAADHKAQGDKFLQMFEAEKKIVLCPDNYFKRAASEQYRISATYEQEARSAT